jgi:hypothetical protein
MYRSADRRIAPFPSPRARLAVPSSGSETQSHELPEILNIRQCSAAPAEAGNCVPQVTQIDAVVTLGV